MFHSSQGGDCYVSVRMRSAMSHSSQDDHPRWGQGMQKGCDCRSHLEHSMSGAFYSGWVPEQDWCISFRTFSTLCSVGRPAGSADQHSWYSWRYCSSSGWSQDSGSLGRMWLATVRQMMIWGDMLG